MNETRVMSRVLLVNPQSAIGVYDRSKIRVAITAAPFVTLASLAGALLSAEHDVRIADLMIEGDPVRAYREILSSFRPEYVGITFTTPLYSEARELADIAKELIPDVVTMCGGIHATSMPREVLEESRFDIVTIGEGERTIVDICGGLDWKDISGIAFGTGNNYTITACRDMIADLDDLPYPAWHLHNLEYYYSPHIASRRNPVGYMETNRGCNHFCTFCSQNVFGYVQNHLSGLLMRCSGCSKLDSGIFILRMIISRLISGEPRKYAGFLLKNISLLHGRFPPE